MHKETFKHIGIILAVILGDKVLGLTDKVRAAILPTTTTTTTTG